MSLANLSVALVKRRPNNGWAWGSGWGEKSDWLFKCFLLLQKDKNRETGAGEMDRFPGLSLSWHDLWPRLHCATSPPGGFREFMRHFFCASASFQTQLTWKTKKDKSTKEDMAGEERRTRGDGVERREMNRREQKRREETEEEKEKREEDIVALFHTLNNTCLRLTDMSSGLGLISQPLWPLCLCRRNDRQARTAQWGPDRASCSGVHN